MPDYLWETPAPGARVVTASYKDYRIPGSAMMIDDQDVYTSF
jgi:hypothetical protein